MANTTDRKMATIEWATLTKALHDSMQRGTPWELVCPYNASGVNRKAFDLLLRYNQSGNLQGMIETVLVHGCNLAEISVSDLKSEKTLEGMLAHLHLTLCQRYPESLMH